MKIFTPGELEVMQVLWKHGALKPADIQAKFPRPIQNAALRSVLLVLLEKGHVTREKSGKAYFYKAKTPRQRTFQSMLKQLTQVFCGGSTKALIAQLIENEKLSDEEIRELQNLARQKTASLREEKAKKS